MEPETQVNILQECPEIRNAVGKCNYESIFKDDVKLLKENAELIIKMEDKPKTTN